MNPTSRAEEKSAPVVGRLDSGAVAQRSFTAVVSLVGREGAVKLLALVGGIVLARTLTPSAFGLFAIANFALTIFALFSDLGFGAAFIRKPGELLRQELDALFTLQLVLIATLGLFLFFAAPLIGSIYRASDLVWLLRALAIALLFMSLRTVPIVVCERNLSYGPIALMDIVGQLAYWIVAVAAALAGWRVWSLVSAVLASAAVGTLVLYARTGWRPSLQFNWRPIRATARFGLLYQGQSITHFFKDTMVPSLGGLVYGQTGVGYLWWAGQLAAVPLHLTHLVARVSYPALSHLQDDPQQLQRMIRATLAWTCRLSLPPFAILAGLAPQIIVYVYGAKWLPALPSLYWMLANMTLSIGTGLLMPALYSAGRVSTGLRISVTWTALTWLLAVGLALQGIGFVGMAVAASLGTASALLFTVTALRGLGIRSLAQTVALPLTTALLMLPLVHLAGSRWVHGLWSLCLVAVVAAVIGLGANLWGDRVAVIKAAGSLLPKNRIAFSLGRR